MFLHGGLRGDGMGLPLVSRSIETLHGESEEVDKLLVEAAEAKSNRDEWNRHLQGVGPHSLAGTASLVPPSDSSASRPRRVPSLNGGRVISEDHAMAARRSPRHSDLGSERDEASFRVLAQECEMLRESRDKLQKRLDIALAELEDEKRLNREISQDISERMREVFVMLPDAKERAVMDLYKEAKKLELSRKCGHEASTNFEKMRKQLARRVSNLQTAVAAESVRNKEIIVSMKQGLASQEEALRNLLQEWEVARSELEHRATTAEAGAEAERRRMYAVVDEVVRKGISDGEQELQRRLEEKTKGAEITIAALTEREMQLRMDNANLEGQMREQERQWREKEAELREEVEVVHGEWQRRFDAACLEMQAKTDRVAQKLQEKEEERFRVLEQSREEEERAARQEAERALAELRLEQQRAQEREKQLHKRVVEAEEQVREVSGQLGACVAFLEAQAVAAESSLDAAFASALASSRDRMAEHRFHLSTITALGDKCKTLVLEKQTLEHDNRRLLLDLGMQAGSQLLRTPQGQALLRGEGGVWVVEEEEVKGEQDGQWVQTTPRLLPYSAVPQTDGAAPRMPMASHYVRRAPQWQWAEPVEVTSPPQEREAAATQGQGDAAKLAMTWQELDSGTWEGVEGVGWRWTQRERASGHQAAAQTDHGQQHQHQPPGVRLDGPTPGLQAAALYTPRADQRQTSYGHVSAAPARVAEVPGVVYHPAGGQLLPANRVPATLEEVIRVDEEATMAEVAPLALPTAFMSAPVPLPSRHGGHVQITPRGLPAVYETNGEGAAHLM